jgi:hypothetical protein
MVLQNPMLIERFLPVGAIGMGFALAGPDAMAILQQQRHEGSVGMLIGGLVGALGVFLGATMAANAHCNQWAHVLRMAVWVIAAILLAATIALGATVGEDILLRNALCYVSVLPVALVAFVVIKQVIATWWPR